jgi:hypothetical protein
MNKALREVSRLCSRKSNKINTINGIEGIAEGELADSNPVSLSSNK